MLYFSIIGMRSSCDLLIFINLKKALEGKSDKSWRNFRLYCLLVSSGSALSAVYIMSVDKQNIIKRKISGANPHGVINIVTSKSTFQYQSSPTEFPPARAPGSDPDSM